jgi:hypothetical protein
MAPYNIPLKSIDEKPIDNWRTQDLSTDWIDAPSKKYWPPHLMYL